VKLSEAIKRGQERLEREVEKLKMLGLKKKSLMPIDGSLDVHSFYLPPPY
jgi:hypothetical protein